MQEQVKATFLVNAAVLLEFRGTKLLIDGIYDENGHCSAIFPKGNGKS